jgi:hypothetical protein
MLGYLAGQITDPFLRLNREDLRKRRDWRNDYLERVDGLQIDDLVVTLKKQRVNSPGQGKKKKKNAAA